ncbi:DUF2786 domain-containing protein [Hydrocarboniphaga effusa]|uniref:DUF2786 domain-containing protein n=1 Tax=Hydrocarboniphaga effusa TaxID=243629 RepID=UPI003BA88036
MSTKPKTDRERALDRIKKCLRLSKSSNEHEAAAALRQAQKLMREHGLSQADVLAAEDASEAKARSGAGRRPPRWETWLSAVVAEAFGCDTLHLQGWSGCKATADWSFIGCGAAPELAAYTFTVMFRQLKRARSEHANAQLKRCGPTTRTRRLDLFSEGWVITVQTQIQRFANDGKTVAAIEAYMQLHYGASSALQSVDRNEGRKLKDRELEDYLAGRAQGQAADLRRPMSGPGAGPTAIEHS